MASTTEIAPRINSENKFARSDSESWRFADSGQPGMILFQPIDLPITTESPNTNGFITASAGTAMAGVPSNAVVQSLIRQFYLGHNGRVVSPGQPGFDGPVDLLSGPASISRRGWAYEKPALTPEEIANLFSIKSAGEESTDSLPEVIAEFAAGVPGYPPPPAWVVELGTELARAAEEHTVEPEISVDVDGELSFDLRLRNGFLVIAELAIGGALNARVYDAGDVLAQRLPDAAPADLLAWLRG